MKCDQAARFHHGPARAEVIATPKASERRFSSSPAAIAASAEPPLLMTSTAAN
jgi:hypothetical protein